MGIVSRSQGGGGLQIPTDITVGATRVHLDADGNLTITSTTATEPVVATEASSGAGDTTFIGGGSGVGTTGDGSEVTRANLSGANIVALTPRGLRISVHAAPADVNIASGDVYLWFDQTNGAGNTKLMIKGKSADGTVKTASLVLA